MTTRAVLTAIGRDRPGLVEEVSELVLASGGSIEDSRMANLGGMFAIMMLVTFSQLEGAAEAIGRLEAGVAELGSRAELRVELTPASEAEPASPPAARLRLTGRALDQPGLVHEVANVLRRFGVNIESMDTSLEAAPVTGAAVFAMDLVVAVPAGVSQPALRDELGRACDALNIDLSLAPL